MAPAAYGGSAMLRALALLPLDLPASVAALPFATTDVADTARTIALAACRWRDGERAWHSVWDVLEGLLAGIWVSLFYMLGAAVLTPDMWIEPLGALVKTGPAIVLMLVALAMLPDR